MVESATKMLKFFIYKKPFGYYFKVLRISRLYDRALDVFEDEAAAEKWLKEPARALREAISLQYAKTELGAQEVERLLIRIEKKTWISLV